PLALVEEPPLFGVAFENFPGISLEVALRERLTLSRALEIACQAAEILYRLHAAQWIHGDLRPDNFLLADDDRLLLIDVSHATPMSSKLIAPLGVSAASALPYVAPE